jgi:hypothetical protein
MRNCVDQRVGLVAQARVAGREHAAPHGAVVLLRGHQQVVAHGHLAEHLQRLEGAADAALVELLRAQAGDVLAVEFDAALVGVIWPSTC